MDEDKLRASLRALRQADRPAFEAHVDELTEQLKQQTKAREERDAKGIPRTEGDIPVWPELRICLGIIVEEGEKFLAKVNAKAERLYGRPFTEKPKQE